MNHAEKWKRKWEVLNVKVSMKAEVKKEYKSFKNDKKCFNSDYMFFSDFSNHIVELGLEQFKRKHINDKL